MQLWSFICPQFYVSPLSFHIGSRQHFSNNWRVVTFPSWRYPMVLGSVLTMNYKNNLVLYRNSFLTETRILLHSKHYTRYTIQYYTALYIWVLASINLLYIKTVHFKTFSRDVWERKMSPFSLKSSKYFFETGTTKNIPAGFFCFLFTGKRWQLRKMPGYLDNYYFALTNILLKEKSIDPDRKLHL